MSYSAIDAYVHLLLYIYLKRRYLPEEIGLFRLTEVADTNVRQHFFLQNFPGVLHPLLFGHTGSGTTRSDEV